MQEAVGDVGSAFGSAALAQRHEHREVGVLAGVLLEVRDLAVNVELLEDYVAHRHSEGAVGAGLDRQPVIGELGVVGVVRAHDDRLLAPCSGPRS